MRPMKVGTKELKNRLSHYLRRVRAGEVVYVTDRGRIVAELRAMSATGTEEARLHELEASGLVTIGKGRLPDFEPIRSSEGTRLSDAIVEERG
jgi:antitoxin (DNA-binding transcriptional repressor) of toxin-antitoxin stability system